MHMGLKTKEKRVEKETKTEEKMGLGEKEEKHKTGGGEGNIRKDLKRDKEEEKG